MIQVRCAACDFLIGLPAGRPAGATRCPRCRGEVSTPPPLPPEDDEPIAVRLVPTVRPVESRRVARPVGDELSSWQDALCFVGRLLFFMIAPIFFAITCVLINQTALLVLLLLTVGLAGFLSNPKAILAAVPWLEKVPLLGNGLKSLGYMHDYYQENAARPFLVYMLYPLAGPALALIDPAARREARLYLGIVGTILAALVVEAAVTYSAVYPPHLTIGDALVWLIARVLFSVLLVLNLLAPVAATTYSFRRAGKVWQLRVLAGIGLVSALYGVGYYALIARDPISFLSSEHLCMRLERPSFRDALRESTEMFLRHHAERRQAAPPTEPVIDTELSTKYRLLIGKLAVDDEAAGFCVLTLPGDPAGSWLAVRLRFHESTNYPPWLIAAAGPRGEFCTTWERLPVGVRAQFQVGSPWHNPESGEPGELRWLGRSRLLDDAP